jgi:uncharacterized membrane protein
LKKKEVFEMSLQPQDNILADILEKWDALQQYPAFNLFLGVVIGLVMVYLVDSLQDKGVSDGRIREIEDKLERVKRLEARLAEM